LIPAPTRSRGNDGGPARGAAPFVALLAAALCLSLVAPGIASAGPQESNGGVIGPGQRPQLLLIHGGSFLFEDPEFEPLTRAAALAAGFVPHYVTYPLDNLPGAVEKVRAEARRLRQKFGVDRVYAYGASAGGTLAALLSGNDLVSGAVAKAPVSDLLTWTWPLEQYGPAYWENLGVDQADRERLSPIRRPEHAPLLLIQGRADHVVPPSMNEAFAAAYPRVSLWLVAGGHLTERARPFLVTRAMEWLAEIAARKTPVVAEDKTKPAQ
jgi:pimeloyl-ACP methyl ester carboxylesterase